MVQFLLCHEAVYMQELEVQNKTKSAMLFFVFFQFLLLGQRIYLISDCFCTSQFLWKTTIQLKYNSWNLHQKIQIRFLWLSRQTFSFNSQSDSSYCEATKWCNKPSSTSRIEDCRRIGKKLWIFTSILGKKTYNSCWRFSCKVSSGKSDSTCCGERWTRYKGQAFNTNN